MPPRKISADPTYFTASAPTTAAVAGASGQIVAASAQRAFLSIFNVSNVETVFLGLGATAVLNSGLVIPPRGGYVFDRLSGFTGAVNAIATGGGATVAIQEGT